MEPLSSTGTYSDHDEAASHADDQATPYYLSAHDPDDPIHVHYPLDALKKEAGQRRPGELNLSSTTAPANASRHTRAAANTSASPVRQIKLPKGATLITSAGTSPAGKPTLDKRFTQMLDPSAASPSARSATPDDYVAQVQKGLQADREFLAALSHTAGVGKEELLAWAKRMREHPVEGALEMIPAYGGPKALFREGKRVVGELGEAGRALGTEGQPLSDRLGAAASHVASAIPVLGGLKDVALDEYAQAEGEPVSPAEDITDPKKYLANLKIATNPKVLGTTTGAAIQAGMLSADAVHAGYKALGDAYAKRATVTPEYLPPLPELAAPAPPFARATTIRPPGLPGGSEAAPGPIPGQKALPAPSEGLPPAEQELEQLIDDHVSQHPKTEEEVRRDLQEIEPENRQAVLDAINQRGLEAYQRGDKAAATEAVKHAWILKGIIQAEARAARAARIAGRPAEAAVVTGNTETTAEGQPAEPQGTLFAQPEPPATAGTTDLKARIQSALDEAKNAPNSLEQHKALQKVAVILRQNGMDAVDIPHDVNTKGLGGEVLFMELQGMLDSPEAHVVRGGPWEEAFGKLKKQPTATPTATPKTTTRPVATAEPESQQGTLFSEPEAAAPIVPRGTSAPKAPETSEPEASGPETFEETGVLADEIEKTMKRPQMLAELGIKDDPRKSDADLALSLAVQRLATGAVKPAKTKAAAKPKTTPAAPATAPAAPVTATPETTPAAETNSGFVRKVANEIGVGRRTRKAKVAEPVAGAAAPVEIAPSTTPAASTVPEAVTLEVAPTAAATKPKAEVRWKEERQTWEATAPEGYVDANGEDARIFKVGEGKEFKTEPQARRAVTKWEAGLIPVEQFRAQQPAAPLVAHASAPTPDAALAAAAPEPSAPAPTAAPVTGPLAVKHIAGSSPSAWQVPGTNYSIHLGDDGLIIHKGEENVGRASSMDDVKRQIQEHMAANPEAAAATAEAAPAKPAARKRAAQSKKEPETAGPFDVLGVQDTGKRSQHYSGGPAEVWQVRTDAGDIDVFVHPGGGRAEAVHEAGKIISDNLGRGVSPERVFNPGTYRGAAELPGQPAAAAPEKASGSIAPTSATPEAAAPTAPVLLPKAPPLPPKPAGSQAIAQSWAEAVVRGRDENAKRATAARSTRHKVPVIATNDDAMVLLDRLSGAVPRSNAKILTAEKADELIKLLRESVANDPEHRQGLAALADAMEAHRTPNGNVILHRHALRNGEINRVTLEELFHDWQIKHLAHVFKNIAAINLKMNGSLSGGAWRRAMSNLSKTHNYNLLEQVIEVPAWIASGEFEVLGISTPEEAAKLLGDYLEVAANILGSGVVDNLPPIAKVLEREFSDEIGRRNIRRHGESATGGGGGGVNTLQPADSPIPEKPPRRARGTKRAAAPEGKLDETQSRQRERDLAPVWYLKSERVIGDKMKGPMPGPDALRMLQNNGISQDELKWTGLDEYLPRAGRVTPDELKNLISQNAIQIEEVTHGAGAVFHKPFKTEAELRAAISGDDQLVKPDGVTLKRGLEVRQTAAGWNIFDTEEADHSSAKYSSYQLPGGKGYRELLLKTAESPEATQRDTRIAELVAERRKAIDALQEAKNRFEEGTGTQDEIFAASVRVSKAETDAAKLRKVNVDAVFRSGHWDEPNVIAHVRMNDRVTPDGKRLLHLEEIQSDWHQAGRKRGYKGNPITTGWTAREGEGDPASGPIWEVRDAAGRWVLGVPRANVNGPDGAILRAANSERGPDGVKVPDAPFKKTWQEMALRRMVRYAAESGYDGVSWTGGEAQADRYDLSKQLDTIGYQKYQPGGHGEYQYRIEAGKDGRRIIQKSGIPESELENVVGKEMAAKIAAGESTSTAKIRGLLSSDSNDEMKVLSGLDLKVGGEGMKGFYDKIVPDYLNKFGKKFGARVGTVEVMAPAGKYGETSLYEGPEPTREELRRIGSDRDTSATINKQARDVLAAMERGQSFQDAMASHSSIAFAEYLGGREVPAPPKAKSFQYLPITDEMYESALDEGVPLFQSRQPEPIPLEQAKAEAEERRLEPDWLRRGVQHFTEGRGGRFFTPPEVSVDPRAMDIADAYDAMKHQPDTPAVRASYDALKKGIDKQWDHATKDMGVTFEPWDKPGQPYSNSAEMKADVENNHHLYFFRGVDMSTDHPLTEIDPVTGLTYNEKMRAIHDLFGHAVEGHQFGPKGEENAWIAHAQMFPSEAIPALTTETKGQNSWFNSGQHLRRPDGTLPQKGDADFIPAKDRPFAENKAGLLPQKFHYRQDAPVSFVSPNTFDLPGVTEAQLRLKSRIHAQFRDQAVQLAEDMGLNVAIENSLGSWQGGAENSLTVHYPVGTDPDLVKYYEASLGRLGYQYATGRFTPKGEGKDTGYLFWVDSKKAGTKQLTELLLKNGIENSTIVPDEGGHTVRVIGSGDSLDGNIDKVAEQLGVRHVEGHTGLAEFPGNYADRDAAERDFGATIEEIESRRPSLGLGQVRKRFESRPVFDLLYNAIREAVRQGITDPFTRVTHGSRTPELVEIDPAYHGKGPQPGAESKRKASHPEYWVDRSYFQIEGTRGEPPYDRFPNQYEGIFNRENLYDLNADPDGLQAQIPDRVRQTGGAITYYEKLIKDYGYDGYFNSERGVVAAFDKTPVEQKLKAGEIKLSAAEPAEGEKSEPSTSLEYQRVQSKIDEREEQLRKSGVDISNLYTSKQASQFRGLRGLRQMPTDLEDLYSERDKLAEAALKESIADIQKRLLSSGISPAEQNIVLNTYALDASDTSPVAQAEARRYAAAQASKPVNEQIRDLYFELASKRHLPPAEYRDEDTERGIFKNQKAYRDAADAVGTMVRYFSGENGGESLDILQSRQRKPEPKELMAEAEERRPRGSTVALMHGLLPRYKDMWRIGDHLESYTRQTLKQLRPGDTSAKHRAMVDRVVRLGRDELKYQLAQENSGVDWYKKDVRSPSNSLISEMKKLHPELNDPVQERMFLLFTAATSPGKTAAFDNVNIGEQVYDLYKGSKTVPLRQPDGKPWGTYGNAPLKTIQALLKHFEGDEAKAMEWMLTKHPLKELEDIKEKAEFSRNTVKNALPPDYDPEAVYGSYILGEKVGPFNLNLNGISTELTVDIWFMRTWNRLMGTLIGPDPKNKKGFIVLDKPRGKNERAAMIAAIDKLKGEFGLETSQVQAALWYYEQGLYNRLGKKGTYGGTYANAAKEVYDLRSGGFTSRSEADAYRRYNALQGTTGGGAGAHPEGVRPKDTEGEGAGSTGELFGDTSFNPEDLVEDQQRQPKPAGKPTPISIEEAQAEVKRRNPRRKAAGK